MGGKIRHNQVRKPKTRFEMDKEYPQDYKQGPDRREKRSKNPRNIRWDNDNGQ